MSKVPGGWVPDTNAFTFEKPNRHPRTDSIPNVQGAFVMRNVLTPDECSRLIDLFQSSHIAAPVSIQGRQDYPDNRMGSVRATAWCEDLATKLWTKMKDFVPVGKNIANDYTSTDWWQGENGGRSWKTIGITPMLRFMRYENGGQHYAHYDAGYIYKDDRYRTLMSFVLYLTTNTDGGATRFIKDDAMTNIPVYHRTHEDWIREVKPEEVLAANYPIQGDILFFDHRICHDVESYHGNGPRIIIRGDILFQSLKFGSDAN